MPRKGKYEEWLKDDKLLILEGWAREGLTDEQIAHNIGINVATLYDWKKKYTNIDNALKKGKEVVDIQVENALLKRALGYNQLVKKTFKIRKVKYSDGRKIEEKEELVDGYDEVHVPPDTTAIIYWLKNRKPKSWRDKPQVDDSTQDILNGINTLTQAVLGNIAPNRKLEDFE